MTDSKLFTPIKVGAMDLANRVVMAPLTRNRARVEDDAPTDLHVEYYAQRAGAGLIISEASHISPQGKGYAWTPGIYSRAQIEGWKKVTDAVHAKGGKIVIQLWHVGRVSHESLQLEGKSPVGPSAIAADSRTFDGEKMLPTSQPRALELSEIPQIIEDYRQATLNAREAGFDGVEVHAANGYLLDQFLRDGSNKRADAYGGSVENRARLLLKVTEAVVGAWDAGHVGIRMSPFSDANDISDSDTMRTFGHAISETNRFGLAYLHLIEGQTGGSRDLAEGMDLDALRSKFSGVYMANNGYDRNLAIKAVEEGRADLVAFGRPYIANPDLAERLAADAPLNDVDPDTLYGGGARGYVDYPTLTQDAA